ncbi:MAG TPA: amidohydrolase [Qipengyuania sp.]|nr:amidohydrolase [Qipengyuania sp.]
MFRPLLAALLATALPAPALADQLVDNVEGIRVDENGKVERFEALWIDDDGRVKEVLQRGDKRPAKVRYRLDGKGRVLMPGLIDAHLHVMGVGLAALTLDLSDTTSLEQALAKIAAFARDNPSRPWIIGRGWNQEKWGLGRFPTAAELDRAVADRPVWLQRVDGHAGWANSAAMKAAGITPGIANPPGGRVERVGKSMAPSGVFVDAAMDLVGKAVPEPRPVDRDNALVEAQKILHRNGITAAADMGTTIEDWQAFRRAGDAGRLTLRIMSYAAGPEAMTLIGGPGPTPWLYDDKLRLNGVKLYLDGALGSRGAWLKQPYADDPGNTGLPLMTQAQFRNTLVRAGLGNFQVAAHAIGDAANAEVLNGIAEVADSFTGDRRWRIEHAQVVDPADLAKFGKHGIIASMQPVHQTSDRLMAEARLGPERLAGTYAWKSIEETGARLAFGSDAPVEAPDAFAGLATAFTRTDAAGEPFGGWRPEERVGREQALAAYTAGAAYAGFAEGRFGTLAVGERADFLLVDRDPLLASPAELRATKVLETWVGGVRVFAAQ